MAYTPAHYIRLVADFSYHFILQINYKLGNFKIYIPPSVLIFWGWHQTQNPLIVCETYDLNQLDDLKQIKLTHTIIF